MWERYANSLGGALSIGGVVQFAVRGFESWSGEAKVGWCHAVEADLTRGKLAGQWVRSKGLMGRMFGKWSMLV